MSSCATTCRFEGFELDFGKFELRENGEARHLEPQVLALLILLVRNADRLVSKDEIVEQVWNGRIVSDSGIASRVKSLRQALRDSGRQQRLIRTVHGRGFRFAGSVVGGNGAPASCVASRDDLADRAEGPPSIAVMPFVAAGHGPLSLIADALADELICDLSRLRSLMVIARASAFRLRNRNLACDEIGVALNTRYCVTGTLTEEKSRIILSIQLTRTRDNAVLWADRFAIDYGEIQVLRQELLSGLAARLEIHILQHETEKARRSSGSALDAWSAYHLALHHMFRFTRSDNQRAASLFAHALHLDPFFSRACSGLSFTCFQNHFLQYSPETSDMGGRARSLADRAVQLDPLDPFAHLSLGRALWFENAMSDSIERLTDCIALSPSYAQAIYSKAWAEMIRGDASGSEANAALAIRLSPLDPLRYAMVAVRSVSALLAGNIGVAANLGEEAARTTGAHKHIALIAAVTAHIDGRRDQAKVWVARARLADSEVSSACFFRSFPFVQSAGRVLIERSLRDLGL